MDEHPWTGEFLLELRNRRGWSVGAAELTVHRDTVVVRHDGRTLAVMDRIRFRQWLTELAPPPYAVDDLVWTVQLGITFLTAGTAAFRVAPESVRRLVAVI